MRQKSFIRQSHFELYDRIIPTFRLICLLLLAGILFFNGYLWNKPSSNWFLIAYGVYTLLLLFSKRIRRFIVLEHPVLVGICELLLATFGLILTGGSQSPAYYSYIFLIAFYGITLNLASSMAVSVCSSFLFLAAILSTGERVTPRNVTQFFFLMAFAVFLGLLNGGISKYNMDIAITDQLTTLYNRRYFMSEVKNNLVRDRAGGLPLYLVVIDVDHFKEINDRFGHLEGDRILHEIGGILRNSVRKGDVAARYGGDEFTLLLEGRDAPDVLSFCENLADTVQNSLRGITVSIGYAAYPGDGDQMEDLFRAADLAMYRQKKEKSGE